MAKSAAKPVVAPPTRVVEPRELPDWVFPVVVIAALAADLLLYWADVLPELVAGTGLAVVLVLAFVGYAVGHVWGAANTALERGVVIAWGVGLLFASFAPAWVTIHPGEPVAHGEVRHQGDSIELPAESAGAVRLWLRGRVGGTGSSAVAFELGGTEPPLAGRFERNISSARAGRRGRVEVAHAHNSEYLSGALAPAVHRLTLQSLEGPLAGPLSVRVFAERWPLTWDLPLAAVLLLLASVLVARGQLNPTVVAIAGLPLGFGVASYLWVTPDVIVKPEIGAWIIGGACGMLVGGVMVWLARKLAAPRLTARPATR